MSKCERIARLRSSIVVPEKCVSQRLFPEVTVHLQ
jgi:hypothetical protein